MASDRDEVSSLAAENAQLKLQVAALTQAQALHSQPTLEQCGSSTAVQPPLEQCSLTTASSNHDTDLRQRLEEARSTLTTALQVRATPPMCAPRQTRPTAQSSVGTVVSQGLSTDDEYNLPAPALAETTHGRHLRQPSEASVARLEAELRCLLASLRHADRELRTARSSIAAGAPSSQPERLRRSRSLDREELQAQLVQTKLRAAQLEFERDEHLMAVRQLTVANRLRQHPQQSAEPRATAPARRSAHGHKDKAGTRVT